MPSSPTSADRERKREGEENLTNEKTFIVKGRGMEGVAHPNSTDFAVPSSYPKEGKPEGSIKVAREKPHFAKGASISFFAQQYSSSSLSLIVLFYSMDHGMALTKMFHRTEKWHATIFRCLLCTAMQKWADLKGSTAARGH